MPFHSLHLICQSNLKRMIVQTKPLSYPIGTIPPTSAGTSFLPSSSQPSPMAHSTSSSSQQMMVMLPLGNNNAGSNSATGGASGAHLVSTDDVINMLQQQHILQVVSIDMMHDMVLNDIINDSYNKK